MAVAQEALRGNGQVVQKAAKQETSRPSIIEQFKAGIISYNAF